MTTRLLLEGSDLAELMAHVRGELGPTARIVRAERVRSGGIGGFFARERYEITVDVPPEPTPRPRAALRAVPTGGIAALLAAADEGDEGLDGTPGPMLATSGPVLATPSRSDFADVLAQVRGVPTPVPALPDDALPELPDTHEERAALAATAGSAMPAVTAQVVASLVAPTVVPEPPAGAGTPAYSGGAAAGAGPGPGAGAGPGAAGGAGAPVAGAHDDPDAPDLREALAEIGIPARLLTGERVTLSSVLAEVPPAPPVTRTPGSVLLVVGADDDADAVAALLAERLRLPAEALRPAGAPRGRAVRPPRGGARMASPEQVAAWRSGASAAEHLWVVALSVGPEPEDRAAAAALVQACAADQVWAVVDARTRTADARRWVRSVASSVDAVAMRGLLDTAEPGAALALGIPVAWIDGVPATTVAWAATLSQALGTEARWD